MQRDLEGLEVVYKHYNALYSAESLRKEKNRVRVLQRQVSKLEAENRILKSANMTYRQAVQQWRNSYANVSVYVQKLNNALRTEHWV